MPVVTMYNDNKNYRMMYPTIALTTILAFSCLQPVCGTTITDLIYECAGPSNNYTATFGWTYELTPGVTLDELRWDRMNDDGTRTFILRLLSGAITTAQAYTNRASTNATDSNGSAFLVLSGITSADEGKYRCTVTDSSLSGIFDEAQLGLSAPPAPLNQLNVMNTTSSSVEIKWNENAISGICKEAPRFHVEYRSGSASWKSAGNVTGSADGNETLSYNVTGLAQNTTYIIAVTATNSQGSSNRIVTGPVTTNATGSAGDNSKTLVIVIPIVVGVVLTATIGTVTWKFKLSKKGLMRLELHILPERKLEVHWTAPPGYQGSSYKYNVVHRAKGGTWKIEEEVTSNDTHNYKDTVAFPDDGSYELYVRVQDADGKSKKSDIEEITVKDTAAPRPPDPRPV